MKQMRLLKMLNGIDDDLITEASPGNGEKITKSTFWKPCAAAACVLTAVSAGVLLAAHWPKQDRIVIPGNSGDTVSAPVTAEANSNTQNNTGNTSDDMEKTISCKVSENGASITAFSSVTEKIIDGAKRYISENGLDSDKLSFIFQNSRYTFSPEYVCKNIIDIYGPEKPSADKGLYYMCEYYTDASDSTMLTGYIVLDEDGRAVEAKNIMTADKCAEAAAAIDESSEAEARKRAAEYFGSSDKLKECTKLLLGSGSTASYGFRMVSASGKRFFIDDSSIGQVSSSVTETDKAAAPAETEAAAAKSYEIKLYCSENEIRSENGTKTVRFTASVPSGAENVRLIDQDNGNSVEMYDNADFASNGDDIKGDGIFSCKLGLDLSSEMVYNYYVECTADGQTIRSEVITVTVYRGFDNQNVSDMKEVNRAVSELTRSESFKSLSQDEKIAAVCDLLTELAENGTENAPHSLILKDSISVSEHSPVVSYRHANGVIGIVDLSEKNTQRY